MLSIQRPPLEDALDGLRHVEPAAPNRRVEHHHAMREQPEHEVRRVVADQVVPDQQHTERRQDGWEGDLDLQAFLPARPARAVGVGIADRSRVGQRRKQRRQFLLEPGMQDRVGTGRDALDAHHSSGRAEQRQAFGRPVAQVFVRLVDRVLLRFPCRAGIRDRLKRARLVLADEGDSLCLGFAIRLLNQPLFASASGSWTVTTPCFRLRSALPVGHQVRVRCQLHPASLSTRQIM